MNRFLNPCRRHRKSLCLLASGLLSDSDRTDIENHLAECAGCQSYYNEIRSVAVPLAAWEKHFTQIEPAATGQMRLAKTIAAGGKPESVRSFTPKTVLSECWQQLFWSSRRIWAGLAAVWILLLAANVSLRYRSSTGTIATASPEMILSFQQQEQLLAELMTPDQPRAVKPQSAQPPTSFVPQPRSEGRLENLMG